MMVGCSREQPHHALLLKAEQLVDREPYETVRLSTEAIKDSLSFNEADHALYGLLMTEGIHKLDIYIMSDSLISQSAEFYQRQGDRKHLARALLHHGIVCFHNHHMAQAVDYMKRAEEIAMGLHDQTLDYDVCETLGELNDEGNNRQLAIRYYLKALVAARKCGDVNKEATMLNNLASAYDRAGDAVRQAECSEKCLPLLDRVDNHVKASIHTNLASIDIKKGFLMSAKEHLVQAMNLEPQETTVKLYADLLALEGRTGLAVDYWYQSLNGYRPYVQIDAYQRLIAHYKQMGHHERALHLSERLNMVYQHLKENTDTTNITELQTKFDKESAEKSSRERLVIMLVAVGVLAMAILWFVWYHRRRMRSYEKTIEKMLREYQSEKESSHQKWDVTEQLLNSPTVLHLHSLAARGKTPQQEDWIELYELGKPFLATLSHFHLSVKETNICMLSKMGFAPSEIAALTSSSPQAVTNSRIRLHAKMFKTKGGAKDFDREIREL